MNITFIFNGVEKTFNYTQSLRIDKVMQVNLITLAVIKITI
jgi:hypothetical protein